MKLVRHSAALLLFALATFHCRAQTAAPTTTPQPSPPVATQPAAPIVRATPATPKTTPKARPAPKPDTEEPTATARVAKARALTASPAGALGTSGNAALLAPGPFNRTVILLDPAHGGLDTGSRISDSVLEKDVTLSLAFKLRSLLAARGFTVVMTRDSDAATEPGNPGSPLTLDDRAGIANHAHPVACLLLHATAAGNGVHLYSSELDPAATEPFSASWLTAQAAWVAQSQRLQQQLATAITRADLPLVSSQASVRPLDSLTCPALIVELAPNGGDNDTLNDAGYQQRVAEAIAGALIFWQNQAQPPPRLAPPVFVSSPVVSSPAVPSPAATDAPSAPASTGAQP